MCSCAGWTSEAEAFEAADTVFRGVVTAREESFLPGGTVHVTFLVERPEKGVLAPDDKIVISTASDGAACGYDFRLGIRYHVFARTDAGGTSSGLCDGNKELGAAPEVPLDPGFPWGWVAVGGGAIVAGGLAYMILRRRRTQLSA